MANTVAGKYMVLDGISSVGPFTISEGARIRDFTVSNSANGRERRPGITEWSGNYFAEGAVPHAMPSEFFTMKYQNTDQNPKGKSGQAIVDVATITWDYVNNSITHTVDFTGNGTLVTHTDALTDTSNLESLEACGTKWTWEDTTVDYEIINIVSAVLTFSARNQDAVNSSTSCKRQRVPGGIDWTASLRIENNSPEDIAPGSGVSWALNQISTVKAFINGTEFWELEYAIVESFSDLTVDPDTDEIVAYTANLGMSAHNTAGDTLGVINKPGTPATQWWPFS